MDPNKFIAEVYRRMDLGDPRYIDSMDPDTFLNNEATKLAVKQYQNVLPNDKDIKILDVGFGGGQFSSACIHLGYQNIHCADFGAVHKLLKVRKEFPQIKGSYDIESTVGDFLGDSDEKFDFIHLAHVIEHIPKHSLLYLIDSIYKSLNKGGTFFVRTPNMLGPIANYSLFVTLGHEYGFSENNLSSLLRLGGFEDLEIFNFLPEHKTLKQKSANILRKLFTFKDGLNYRLFNGVYPKELGIELVISGIKKDKPELFDKKFK
jgi:2-polyprenyl-3-methyl-5-hydroxy-6-metoxy-1,4-benzoquinol methylase